jgi:hypothetical protein
VPALIAGAEQGLLPAIREGGRWRFHGPTVRAGMESDTAPEARRRLLGQG